MEKIITRVTDEDFGLPVKKLYNPVIRYGTRGIIFNSDGNIAVFNKVKKNEFKLPGGGFIDGESPEQCLVREVFEETGCSICKIKKLGLAIEEKGQTNFRQISHVFEADVYDDTHELHLTEKEFDEGGGLLWLPIRDAYETISRCIDNVSGSDYDDKYRTLFMVKRDALILKYYLEQAAHTRHK